MLDIYICEKNESDRSKVLATCNEYYIDHNYDNREKIYQKRIIENNIRRMK